ncbi:hypothetical protein [Mangrovibacterium sp.]|uniref:hypothetical protein n=1 Tax=Mangrovibacterium sp. TaxID=1961364 RepID=UPI00356751CF
MKHSILLFLFLSLGFILEAQEKIDVQLEEKTMSKGQQMAVVVVIPESTTKDVDPIWKRYINNRSLSERFGNLSTSVGNIFKNDEAKVGRDKLKVEKKGDEWYVRAIDVYSISDHKLDVYARVSDSPDGCRFAAFFEYTDSVFINQSNAGEERLLNMKSFIRSFAVEVYQSVVDDQIKEAEKVLSGEEKSLRKIESNSRRENRAISGYQVDIQEYEAEIRGIENEIGQTDARIAIEKGEFALMSKKTPAYDAMKVQLKELSKAKSKKYKQIKSYRKKIAGKEGDIKSSNTKISQNLVREMTQQKMIQEKEKIVADLEAKKQNIR